MQRYCVSKCVIGWPCMYLANPPTKDSLGFGLHTVVDAIAFEGGQYWIQRHLISLKWFLWNIGLPTTCWESEFIRYHLEGWAKETSLSCEKVMPGCAWLVLSKTGPFSAQACIRVKLVPFFVGLWLVKATALHCTGIIKFCYHQGTRTEWSLNPISHIIR